MSFWILTGAYWLHMAATVVWIGGLFYFAAILVPVLESTNLLNLEPDLLEKLRKRFNPLAWLSLTILILTGLIQMTANPQYLGILSVENRWSIAIFAKHLAIVLMVIFASYQTWILQPKLSRQILESSVKGAGSDPQNEKLIAGSYRLARFNLLLGFLVLILTAIARTA